MNSFLIVFAQATQPEVRGGFREWSTGEWIFVIGFFCATVLPGIAAFWNSVRNKKTTSNLADAIIDVATVEGPSGKAMDNVSPGTLPTLKKISGGGTGGSGLSQNAPDQWNNK